MKIIPSIGIRFYKTLDKDHNLDLEMSRQFYSKIIQN
jgi:hypothetical protein